MNPHWVSDRKDELSEKGYLRLCMSSRSLDDYLWLQDNCTGHLPNSCGLTWPDCMYSQTYWQRFSNNCCLIYDFSVMGTLHYYNLSTKKVFALTLLQSLPSIMCPPAKHLFIFPYFLALYASHLNIKGAGHKN